MSKPTTDWPQLFARAPRSVRIVEVGPRDGLQNESRSVSTQTKIDFVNALTAAGHSHIEVTSFVNPERVPQLADAAEVLLGITRKPGVTYTALVPNEKGLQRALDAGVESIAVFTAASETFNQRNIGCSILDSLQRFRPVLAVAGERNLKVRGYVSTAFVCPFEGNIAPEKALDVMQQLRDLGVRSISLGDTIGAAFPHQVARLVELAAGRWGTADIALHLHDTHHRAIANALAGLLLGIEELDASTAGLGGCPFAPGAKGNLSTEVLVEFLEGMGIDSGIDRQRQSRAAQLIRAAIRAG